MSRIARAASSTRWSRQNRVATVNRPPGGCSVAVRATSTQRGSAKATTGSADVTLHVSRAAALGQPIVELRCRCSIFTNEDAANVKPDPDCPSRTRATNGSDRLRESEGTGNSPGPGRSWVALVLAPPGRLRCCSGCVPGVPAERYAKTGAALKVTTCQHCGDDTPGGAGDLLSA